MEVQEKKKQMKLQQDMSWKMYRILTLTASIANLIGTISNFLLHGFETPTTICGICFLAVLITGTIGLLCHKVQAPAVIIILLAGWIEFPYLYYCYGNTTIVYLVLGVVAMAVFFPRRMVIVSFTVMLMEYLFIILYSSENPVRWRQMDEVTMFGSTIGSLLIVAISVFMIIYVLIRSYERQQEQLIALSENLEFAANHDPLTKLYNRRYLVQLMEEWMHTPDKNFWIILLDVDDFKAVNDTYGHGYGDDVLREIGRLMLHEMEDKGIASRFGGEEFMLVFEADDREQALFTFQKIQEGLLAFSRMTRQTDITISGGLERYVAEKQLDLLFTSVDHKLYAAKNAGKNRIVE